MKTFTALIAASFVGSFLAFGGYEYIPRSLYDPACNIKGNISYSGGQRIYHVPGQHYYNDTRISAGKGERWFCTEEEARAAGWRKAGY